MQLYTKILIGMTVGVLLGLFLGPRSFVLPKDLYVIDKAAQITLYAEADPDGRMAPLPVAADASLDLHLLRADLQHTDPQGTPAPRALVSFAYDRSLALRDPVGTLAAFADKDDPSKPINAWMPLKRLALEGGGVALWPEPVSATGQNIIGWVAPIGALFMRLIQMVIVPLVFASLLVGVAGLGDVRKLGRLGSRTLGIYLGTTAIAVSLGLAAARLIQPGRFMSANDSALLRAQFDGAAGSKASAASSAPSLVENLLAIVPTNPLASLVNGEMLQIIFFAALFGVVLTLLPKEKSRPVIEIFDTVQEAMIQIIHLVMKLAPYGVAALLAEVVGQSGWTVLRALAMYSVAVLAGLFVHTFLIYGSLVRFVGKMPFFEFLRCIRSAQMIAFSTSSSSAALPVSLDVAERKLRVSSGVASFVLPLGATVNMDGTALYQGVAAIFVAQVFGIDLSLSAQLGVVLTATAASIGAAGVPGAGMITLTMVLTAAQIPAVGVALILGADRFLDMFRTAVNVTGDLAVTKVISVLEGERAINAEDLETEAPPQSPG